MKVLLAVLCLGLLTITRALALDPTTAPEKHRPYVGMAMDQALAYYGAPFHRANVEGGERWYYHLKFAEVYGRAFVPFWFDSDNVRLGSITFGADRKVKSVDWNAVVLHHSLVD